MATYYWRGDTGGFLLPSGWMTVDASGQLSPTAVAPSDADAVVFDSVGMRLSADAAFAGLLQLALTSAGMLNLGDHTLTLLNTAQLGDSGSRISGPGTLETRAISVVPAATGNGPAVQLAGGAVWSNSGLVMDAGAIGLGSGAGDSAIVINQPGALFALATDQSGQIATAAGANAALINDGTLAKTGGTGLSTLTTAVDNTGVITASSGTLALQGGGTLGGTIGGDTGVVRVAGTYTLASGTACAVAFSSGAMLGADADGPAVLFGPGTLDSSGPVQIGAAATPQLVLAGGATWNNAGSINAASDLVFDATGGTLVNQAGANLAFSGDAGLIALAPDAGDLVNRGTLSRTGSGISRIAVPIADSGSIVIAGGVLECDAGGGIAGPVSGSGTLALAGGLVTLANGGLIAAGGLTMQGATLLTPSNATATVACDVTGADGTLVIGGGGALTLAGAVDASQTIEFDGVGATLTLTDVTGFAPAAINGFVPGDALLVADSSSNIVTQLSMLEGLARSGRLTAIHLTDAGTPTLSLSAAQRSAGADVLARIATPYQLASGVTWIAEQSGSFDDAAQWSGGSVPDADADAVIDSAGQPTVTISGTHALHTLANLAGHFILNGGILQVGQLDNESSLAWNGGSIALDGSDADSSGLVNGAGATLSILANGQQIGGTGDFANAGAMLISGTGQVALDTPLVNTGSLVVTQGTLELNAGGRSTGSIEAQPGGNIVFGGGSFAVTGGYAGNSTTISGGTLDISTAGGNFRTLLLSAGGLALGTAAADSNGPLLQSGGTLDGSGSFVAFAGAQLSGGVQTGPGSTRLLGRSTISGTALDGGRTLRNDGALTWSSGDILAGSGDTAAVTHGATLSNTGVLRLTAQATIGPANDGSSMVTNAGVISVQAGAGSATMEASLLNAGIVVVESGTLSLAGPVSGGGLFEIAGGAELAFANLVGAGETLRFLGGGGTLAIDQTGPFAMPVAGFAAGDVLDLTALDFAAGPSARLSGGRLTVSDGTHSAMLSLIGSYAASGFQLTGDAHGGVLVRYS